jgi:hypothetical protein
MTLQSDERLHNCGCLKLLCGANLKIEPEKKRIRNSKRPPWRVALK